MITRQRFIIDERLPGRNECDKAYRGNKYAGNKLKQETQERIQWYARAARLQPVRRKCVVVCVFTEGNRRRDVDNVESAAKYILDALVAGGWLIGDSPRYVLETPGFTHYDDGCRVEVVIVEGEEDELHAIIRQSEREITGV